jgi:phage shock protein PspC (stress-responsive transcriptional regulator)
MRTVITISLNGNAYQLDAVGYEALRAYLQGAEQRLAGNPDQGEILADLEQAIADKCGSYLGPHKNVVSADEIAEVLRAMGPVDGGTEQGTASAQPGVGSSEPHAANAAAAGEGANGGSAAGGAGDSSGGSAPGSAGAGAGSTAGEQAAAGEPPRRLYQIREGAMISGVCKGLAAYLNIDVSIIRALFIVLVVLTGGVWILVYIVMMFVIPYAQTSEQHAAAHGWPFNAEELVARAKAHYAEFRNSGKWQRKQWREERRMWRSQHRQWRRQQRAWERCGSAQGAPQPTPPPPPWWTGQQPPNASYSMQVMNGFLSPIVGILGSLLFIAFLIMLVSLITQHRIFGWWLPHDIPLWLGIVILVVLYRAIAEPLKQARYAAYHGSSPGPGWLAFWGALVWLVLVTFLCWLAWQHWSDVREFIQDVTNGWWSLISPRPATVPAGPEHATAAAAYSLAWAPFCLLQSWLSRGKVQSHGEVDGSDVLGEPADGDVVDAGGGDLAHGLE